MALRDNIVFARNTHGLVAFGGNATFTPVAGVTTYKVTLCGGGGGGGGSHYSWGTAGAWRR